MNSKRGELLLLPNLLSDESHHEIYLPKSVDKAVQTLDGLIAENERAGRRYLKRFRKEERVDQIPMALFSVHTRDDEIDFILEPIQQGETWGLVSDAGLPCIADPGSKLVFRARQMGITIKAFIGPSSILLALMQSGLPAQKFAFHGYLAREEKELVTAIKKLEREARQDGMTQLFMETPYRSQELLKTLLNALDENTMLSVAWDLTLPTQGVVTEKVGVWKKRTLPNIEKKPAIFLFASC